MVKKRQLTARVSSLEKSLENFRRHWETSENQETINEPVKSERALLKCAKAVEKNKVLSNEMADWDTVIADGLDDDE